MAFIKCFWLIGKFSKKNILRHFDIIEYKSNLFHEIIHYLDSLRIANYTVDKSILCSGLEYTSRPDEFNAYYQQLAFCVISEFNYILDEYIRNNNLDIVKLADELKLVPSKFNEFVAAIKNTYKGLRFNKVYNRKFIKRLTNLQLELFDELNNRNNNG
jgi:hypothetical protein